MNLRLFGVLALAGLGTRMAPAQTTPAQTIPAQSPAATQSSVVGAVTKVDPDAKSLTIKTDAGAEAAILILPTANYRRVAPGETDLRNAAVIALGDIKVGDRVLARGQQQPNQIVSAGLIVVMSQGDIAKMQAAEHADWERRGIVGLVTAVTADSVTVSSRTLTGTSQVTIAAAKDAIIRRYAPDSVKFSDAKPGKLSEIKTGDQVRARGEKSADGKNLAAEELVSGTFKTIAGVVLSFNAAAGEMRVNDLETKKPVTVKVNPDSNLRKLQPQTAQMIAARLRANAAPPQAGGVKPPPGTQGVPGGPGAPASGGAAPDFQQMLDRSPNITLADLKAGDAIVVSSTVGATAGQITAITLLAGVEPILTKPGTREMSLGSWSLDMGGGAP